MNNRASDSYDFFNPDMPLFNQLKDNDEEVLFYADETIEEMILSKAAEPLPTEAADSGNGLDEAAALMSKNVSQESPETASLLEENQDHKVKLDKNARNYLSIALAALVVALFGIVLAVNIVGAGHFSKENNTAAEVPSANPSEQTTQDALPAEIQPANEGAETQSSSENTSAEENTAHPDGNGYQTIKLGDRNDDVMKLQKRLVELHYIAEDSCTGYYGTFTAKIVTQFQHNAGLSETGEADPSTLVRLYASDAPAATK